MSWGYGAHSIRQTRDSVHYQYEEVRHPVTKRGVCPVCGKKRNRSTTFTNTISPFNKDPETGLPRTRTQILDVLAAKADAWVPDFTCQDCE